MNRSRQYLARVLHSYKLEVQGANVREVKKYPTDDAGAEQRLLSGVSGGTAVAIRQVRRPVVGFCRGRVRLPDHERQQWQLDKYEWLVRASDLQHQQTNWGLPRLHELLRQRQNIHGTTFGPLHAFGNKSRYTPFIFAGIGKVRASDAGSVNNSFAWLVGGGFTVRITRWVSFQTIPVEYVMSTPNGNVGNNFLARVGLALTIPK
jgi:hypothetical protein